MKHIEMVADLANRGSIIARHAPSVLTAKSVQSRAGDISAEPRHPNLGRSGVN